MLTRAAVPCFILSLTVSLVVASSVTNEPKTAQDIITELKDLQRELGFPETRNFEKYDPGKLAFYRCYYTGKLELPSDYEEIGLRQSEHPGCDMLDPGKYDIFAYAMEAVASGETPVTESLAQTSLERLMVIVPHEDFHHQENLEKLPPSLSEAAATLAGFITAAEFAKQRFGKASDQYKRLSQDAALYLKKAEVVNGCFGRLSSLYDRVRLRQIRRENALAQKDQYFARLREECTAIAPDPASFNKCPVIFNNAALAFEATYTRHYPLMYNVFLAHNSDVKAALAAITSALSGRLSEHAAIERLQEAAKRPALPSAK